ncbi:phenylacetate--CoA ligase [Candidatus Poribacteria bacterium]|nr:phenylacetate--CoA ligase [Candidatus Poribacteria bacterium]
MMYWEKDIETINADDLKNLQLERFKSTLFRAALSPYYSKLFNEIGFNPAKVRSLKDIENIPFTTKKHLRENYPYGFLAVPKDEIVRMHSSTGTTGRATVIFHTMGDIDRWANLVARCMYMAGARKSDVFQNTMGYGLFTGGLGFHYGAEKIGMMVIPSGPGNSVRQISLMSEFGTTAVHILPSYALHLLDVFEENNLNPKNDVNLHIAFIGAEPHSEEMRKKIQDSYEIEAFNSYGLSEMNGPGVAFECPYKNGLHVWEDSFIMEIINPNTEEPVTDGEEGELVFTTINREAMPLIRYRTRDLASVYTEPCPCGRTHRRISRIKGRSDDMLIIKGVNLFPMQVETVLMGFSEIGRNYQIILETREHMDDLIIEVEVTKPADDMRVYENLRKRIADAIRAETLVSPKVNLLQPGTIQRVEGKAIRVIDKREK